MNEKFRLLNESLKALDKDMFNLLILKGEAGFGKTHRTIDSLKNNGIDYEYVNAYVTPLKFYEILYKNRDKKVIVFDDVQSIDNPLIIGLLKSACWAVLDNQRTISYMTTSTQLEKIGLPDSFDFKANIILIFNNEIPEYNPIISRGVQIEFNFNFKEKMEIFREMEKEANLDDEVLDYVETHCQAGVRNLSIRSLVILSNLKRGKFDFEMFAKEMFRGNDEINLLIHLVSKSQSISEACDTWIAQTGHGRATFFRIKKKLGL
jgi:hypothetical protein